MLGKNKRIVAVAWPVLRSASGNKSAKKSVRDYKLYLSKSLCGTFHYTSHAMGGVNLRLCIVYVAFQKAYKKRLVSQNHGLAKILNYR